MRKSRNFDSDMKTLNERAKLLKERKLRHLGELVIATGADTLDVEQLAGALLAAADAKDAAVKEGWRRQGAAFFQRSRHRTPSSADRDASGGASSENGTQPPAADAGAS